MKRITTSVFVIMLLFGIAVISYSTTATKTTGPSLVLKEAPDETDERSQEAFNKMMDVLTHQRCVNCHPSDNIPKQGEDSHNHRFEISRTNSVTAATNCNTCHQSSNNDFSGVPGAPEWSLAPHNMRWEGLSRVEIAKSMMNPENNGNRSPEDVMHHLTEHELVLWAWDPGVDAEGNPREIPPVSKEEYIAAVKEWIELGAQIPEE